MSNSSNDELFIINLATVPGRRNSKTHLHKAVNFGINYPFSDLKITSELTFVKNGDIENQQLKTRKSEFINIIKLNK